MEITESSNPKSKLFCSVRREWVNPLPEEKVRLGLIQYMTTQLGYPLELIALERALDQFPHLQLKCKKSLPKRRADLVCYGKGIHPDHELYPLLLVECKAVPLTPKAFQQLTGYNHYLQAFFVALCNDTEIKFGTFDEVRGGYAFRNGLPSHQELLGLQSNRQSRI